MTDERITEHSVVQVDPKHDPAFAGCLLVVTQVKERGVVGYALVPGPGRVDPGVAFCEVPFEAVVYVGQAEWMVPL